MKKDSYDLAIQWKTIHELTWLLETSIKPIDTKIVNMWEPKPYETTIQPKLINWSNLEIPRKWLISELTEETTRKSVSNVKI